MTHIVPGCNHSDIHDEIVQKRSIGLALSEIILGRRKNKEKNDERGKMLVLVFPIASNGVCYVVYRDLLSNETVSGYGVFMSKSMSGKL